MFQLNFLPWRATVTAKTPADADPAAVRWSHRVRRTARRHMRPALLSLGLAAVALPLLAPIPAYAWWRGGVWVGGPVYYAPPHAYYVPPPAPYYVAPPAIYAPPPARWVPGHYNWRGYWIPGHWGP